MTIQTITTDFRDTSLMPMYMEYHDWYEYEDRNGVKTRNPQSIQLAIATIPDDYLRIECTVYGWSDAGTKYDIRIFLPDDCTYVISSFHMNLIEFVYKRILNKQDTWASDITEALPELLI